MPGCKDMEGEAGLNVHKGLYPEWCSSCLLPKTSSDIKICLCMPGTLAPPSALPAVMSKALKYLGSACLGLSPTQKGLM